MSAVLAVGLLVFETLTIQGTQSCPSAEEVLTQLRTFAPAATAGRAEQRVRLERIDGALDVELHADSPLSFHRRLPRLRSCAEEAMVAATIIAAWQGGSTGTLLAARLPRHRPRIAAEVDVAFVAAFAGSAFAPGAALEVRLAAPGGGPGAWLGLFGQTPRDFALGDGSASWSRSAFRAGFGYRFWPGRWRLDVRAEGLLALLYLQGSGFEKTYRHFDFDVGVGAGARAGVQLGQVRPFVALDVAGWLRPAQAWATKGDTRVTSEVPRLDVLLSAGIAVGGGSR